MAARRLRSERGASIIELALVLPLLALLAFAVAEVGLAWTAENKVQNAVSSIARTGTSAGRVGSADALMLISLNAALPPSDWPNLDRVVIYEASSADGRPPAGCIREPNNPLNEPINTSLRCNSYSGAFVRSITSSADSRLSGSLSSSCTDKQDRFWCPHIRQDTLGAAGGPSWLGIWVRILYPNPVPFFFDDFTLEKYAVYRIQPDYTG